MDNHVPQFVKVGVHLRVSLDSCSREYSQIVCPLESNFENFYSQIGDRKLAKTYYPIELSEPCPLEIGLCLLFAVSLVEKLWVGGGGGGFGQRRGGRSL